MGFMAIAIFHFEIGEICIQTGHPTHYKAGQIFSQGVAPRSLLESVHLLSRNLKVLPQ